MTNKLDKAYKSIGEVAEILKLKNSKNGKLNTYIIRFWESEFKQIKPRIFSNKRRYYDKKAIDLLIKIKFLLKEQGMTIKGVKNILNDKTFKLDDISNETISNHNNYLKKKVGNISNIIKDIKRLK